MGFRGSPVRIRPSRLGKGRFGKQLTGAVFFVAPHPRRRLILSPILSVQSRLPDKGRTTDYRDMGQHDHTQILSPGELPPQRGGSAPNSFPTSAIPTRRDCGSSPPANWSKRSKPSAQRRSRWWKLRRCVVTLIYWWF